MWFMFCTLNGGTRTAVRLHNALQCQRDTSIVICFIWLPFLIWSHQGEGRG